MVVVLSPPRASASDASVRSGYDPSVRGASALRRARLGVGRLPGSMRTLARPLHRRTSSSHGRRWRRRWIRAGQRGGARGRPALPQWTTAGVPRRAASLPKIAQSGRAGRNVTTLLQTWLVCPVRLSTQDRLGSARRSFGSRLSGLFPRAPFPWQRDRRGRVRGSAPVAERPMCPSLALTCRMMMRTPCGTPSRAARLRRSANSGLRPVRR